MDGPPTTHGGAGMSASEGQASAHGTPEKPMNRTLNVHRFGEVAHCVSPDAFLSRNSRAVRVVQTFPRFYRDSAVTKIAFDLGINHGF